MSSSDSPESPVPDQQPPDRRIPPVRVRTRRPPVAAPTEQPSPAPEPTATPLDADSGDEERDPEGATRANNSYEVGYAKPPKHTRFQPGRSGNPRGRPKGSRSLATLVADALEKTITAKIGRRTVTMKRREALAHRLVEQALGGDLRAVALLLKLDPGALTQEADAPSQDAELPPEEAAMLRDFLRGISGEG